jgi:hypothetical protein
MLGLSMGTGGEGAKFWLGVPIDLRNQGVHRALGRLTVGPARAGARVLCRVQGGPVPRVVHPGRVRPVLLRHLPTRPRGHPSTTGGRTT